MKKFLIISTTADVGLKIKGQGQGDFYKHALLGMNALLFDSGNIKIPRPANPQPYPINFKGDSLENLLVKLLNEILFITYTKQQQVVDMQIRKNSNQLLQADLLLIDPLYPPLLEIKSATYHNLRIENRGGILSGTVIFDI